MSDYLQAASFIHSGKDWAFNAANHLEQVMVHQTDQDFHHFVYSLPREYMRSNAATFADWQSNEEGCQKSLARKTTLCWFLEFINRLCKTGNKKLSAGDRTLIFFEIVFDETGNIVKGERIHVFIERPELKIGKVISDMFEKASKKDNRKKKIFDPWDYHQRHVKTKEEYILNVCNVYLNNTSMTSAIYKANALLDDALVHNFVGKPSNVFSLTNFEIKGASTIQNDITEYYDSVTKTFKFPNDKLIIKRFWHQLEPSYIWKKYLPSYQYVWVDLPEIRVTQNSADKNLYDVYIKPCPARCIIESYMNSINIDKVGDTWQQVSSDQLTLMANHAKGRFTIHELKSRTEMITIENPSMTGIKIYDDVLHQSYGSESMEYTDRLKSKYQNQHSISAFDVIELETSYRMEYSEDTRNTKETMVDKFEKLCVSGDSDISSAGKAIARWKVHLRPELENRFGSFSFEIKDPSLSPFANMQYWFSQGLDSFMCVASAHSELTKLHYAVYDAYRQHGENQLHWNMIYTGEGATSKSFVFEQKGRMCIPGTMTEITYQTTRADAVDGDQNDHITVFNEAPPGLFQATNKGEDAQKALSAMKEKLTSNRVRTKEFVRDEETGERKNRIAISSQIGCYVGATNDNPALAEEAVKTRFHWGEFDKVFRKDKSISDYQRKAFEMESKPELKEKYEQFIYYCQDQQMKVFYVWKLIFCGIIRDIDLDGANIVLENIGNQLKKKDIRIPPRTTERFRILCRILTITNALDILFNFKGGKHNGKKFELKQLLDIEPMLYCTEEISICALNMVAVEIPQLSVSRTKTLRALWRLFQYSPSYKKEKDLVTGMTEKMDYNYIRFTGGMKQFLVKIQNAIPFYEGKPSLHNIHGVLRELSAEPFKARSYQELREFLEENPGSEQPISDKFPVPKARTERKTAVAFSFGTNFFDVHIGLFYEMRLKDSSKGTIMTECIKNIVHANTMTRRIVTGIPERTNSGVVEFPQFMQVVELIANPDINPPKIKNSSQESEGVKRMMGLTDNILGAHDVVIMDTDTDTWAWSRRCMTFLGMDKNEAFEYHPIAIKHRLKVSLHNMKYPEDLKYSENNQEDARNEVHINASESMGLDLEELTRAYKRRRVGNSMRNMSIEV